MSELKISNREIIFEKEKCTGCGVCALWCSYMLFKKFIPSKANIIIQNEYDLVPNVHFLDTCTKCGQCALHCPYGALIIKEEKE